MRHEAFDSQVPNARPIDIIHGIPYFDFAFQLGAWWYALLAAGRWPLRVRRLPLLVFLRPQSIHHMMHPYASSALMNGHP